MRIEQVCELHEYSPEETGDFHLYDDDDVEIGVLEYHIDSSHGVLHIDNLKNKAAGVYSGVGSALMNEAVKLSLSKHVGFSFEIAKGSEPFYQSWIPASFARDDSDRRASGLFQRISSGLSH